MLAETGALLYVVAGRARSQSGHSQRATSSIGTPHRSCGAATPTTDATPSRRRAVRAAREGPTRSTLGVRLWAYPPAGGEQIQVQGDSRRQADADLQRGWQVAGRD